MPRIRNNDDYLQSGLDFSRRIIDDGAFRTHDSLQNESNSNTNNNNQSPIGDIGAVRLSDALQFNTQLLHLNLSGNDIGVIGGVQLAQALYSSFVAPVNDTDVQLAPTFASRTALQSLDLSRNNISDDGALGFATAIRYNTTLKVLNLSCNRTSKMGVMALLDGLECNTTLKRLSCIGNLKGLKSDERTELVKSVGKVMRKGCVSKGGSVLEVLELHDNDEQCCGGSSFGGFGEQELWQLVQAMYAIDEGDITILDSMAKTDVTFSFRNGSMLRNHRLQTLTLPSVGLTDNVNNAKIRQQSNRLERILQFNTFYRPIMELHDILDAAHSTSDNHQQQPYFSKKVPYHLQRDAHSGAVIGLLPSASSAGIGLKEMPRLLAILSNECSFDTMWNVVRHRPDVVRYAGTSRRVNVVRGQTKGFCVGCIVA